MISVVVNMRDVAFCGCEGVINNFLIFRANRRGNFMCFERVICAVVSSAFLPKARSSLCVGPYSSGHSLFRTFAADYATVYCLLCRYSPITDGERCADGSFVVCCQLAVY